MSGDQIVALICSLPVNDSSANVDFNIASQNVLFLSRECSFEQLLTEIKNCLGAGHLEDISLWGKYHQNQSEHGGTIFPIPITNNQSWSFFVSAMLLYGPLLICVRRQPAYLTTNVSFAHGISRAEHTPINFGNLFGGPSRRNAHADPPSTVHEMEALQLGDTDFESDGSSDSSGSGEGADYWNGLDDSEEYVPPVAHVSSSTTSQFTSYSHRSDTSEWYDDVDEYGRTIHSHSSSIQVGMVFESYQELKKLVAHHNLAQHRHFKSLFKQGNYWKATCLYPDQCAWMITASKVPTVGHWIVKKFNDKHSCRVDYSEGGEDYILTSQLIADLILPKIEEDPKYKIKYVQQDVKAKWGVDVDYKKAWYGRVRALETLYGTWEDSYNVRPQMLLALQQTNPGTVIDIVANPSGTPNEYQFKYAFWAFKPAIDGFKYCLPVLTIDGTHLYGKYGGHLLLAVSMNANKEIFPIAYSIVDGETGDSWTWFLKLLAHHVFGDVEYICIISDRHGGIDVAFRDLPELSEPRIQRRYCLRHLRSNLMTKFKNKTLKTLVWQAGCAFDTRAFEATMKKIRAIDDGAYNYLNAIPPRYWAISHDGGFRHGLMTTNSSESFNNTLKGCRILPVSALVKVTYEKLALQFAQRRTHGLQMQQAGLKWPRRIVDDMLKRESHKYRARVKRHDDVQGIYFVAIEGVVNASRRPIYVGIKINERVCNCGKWSVDGLPCIHAHAACHYVGRVADCMVPEKFSLSNYIMSYEGIIMPLVEEAYWPPPTYKLLPPEVPAAVHRPGRRQMNRIPNEMDLNVVRHPYKLRVSKPLC